jgi:transposase
MDISLIASVGIDLGKTTFHLVALDCHAKVILRKKFSRTQLLAFTANLPWSIIGMEACSGAHFFAAKLRDQGHEVKLIPGQFVKPFVKTNKNDFNDAEAIAEAVIRQNMRFVPIKTCTISHKTKLFSGSTILPRKTSRSLIRRCDWHGSP